MNLKFKVQKLDNENLIACNFITFTNIPSFFKILSLLKRIEKSVIQKDNLF